MYLKCSHMTVFFRDCYVHIVQLFIRNIEKCYEKVIFVEFVFFIREFDMPSLKPKKRKNKKKRKIKNTRYKMDSF